MNTITPELAPLPVLHHVYGGLCNFFGLFPILHIGLGLAMVHGALPASGQGSPPPAWLGYLFVAMGSFFLLVLQSVGILNHVIARKIAKGTHAKLVFVVSVVNCLFFPFGTALGAYTIIVLNKPSSQAFFGVPARSPGAVQDPDGRTPASAP